MNNILVFIVFFTFTLFILLFLTISTTSFNIAELMSDIKTEKEIVVDNFIFQKKYILDNPLDMNISSGRMVINGKKIFIYYDGKIKYLNSTDINRLMLILRDKK